MRKLKKYKPTPFKAKDSTYSKGAADYAVGFIECLCHTKGTWAGKPFELIDWQEQIIRDVFGTLKPNGYRQFNTAYIEIPKKMGKSELAAAVALLLCCGDGEERAEVYGCAADRQQAGIVFDVAADMVRMCPALSKRVKILTATKRIIYTPTNSFYQVLSAEAYSKHGFNIHGVVFDELHTQPNRKLFDVMTKGSGDARMQPLYFLITTAGTNTRSICYETHQKAKDILEGRKIDPTFYPVIYGADEGDDWTDPKVWKKANPSLGITVGIDKVRAACDSAKQNPAEENSFRQLRLNQWVKQAVRWMPMERWDKCAFAANEDGLEGRVCYGGLDLSSTTDITAFVLVFPPVDEDDKYSILPYFWIPEDNLDLRVRRDHVPYDVWKKQGFLQTTEGNVVHYGYIEKFIERLGERFNIREIAFDRWGAVQMVQNLEGMGFTVVPFGQGFELSRVEAVPAVGGGGIELEKPELNGAFGEGGVEVEHMVAAVVVVLVSAVGGVVGAVPNVGQVAHGAGLTAVDRFDEPGIDRPAIPAHAVVVEGQGIRQEALVAGHDVRQVAEGLGGVALGPDVDVDPAASGVVALGSGLAQPPHQLLEGIHVGIGEDRRDHLALFAVRPLDAHVPLELPLPALGIPGRPGVVAVAVGGVLEPSGAEELGGEFGGGVAGDAVHLDLDPDGLLFHLGDLVFHFLVHGADLRFLCVRRGVFPFGSDIFALKRRYSKSIRAHKVHNHSELGLCSLWSKLHQRGQIFALADQDVQHELGPGAEPVYVAFLRRGGAGGELGGHQPLQRGKALAVQVFPEEGLGIGHFLHRLFQLGGLLDGGGVRGEIAQVELTDDAPHFTPPPFCTRPHHTAHGGSHRRPRPP